MRRRHVFYVPGYDPEGRTRYRMLFVRELTLYAKRFGQPKRRLERAVMGKDGLSQRWTVAAEPAVEGAETSYDVLLWDDLVLKDFARWRILSVVLLFLGSLHAIVTGMMVRFYRLNWKYGNVILYPLFLILLLTLVSGLIAHQVHAHLGEGYGHSLRWPFWLTVPLGLMVGIVWIKSLDALLERAFFWQLLNDWVFNWQHGQGWRPDYDARVDAFAALVVDRLATFRAEGIVLDEVVILGHSTGALTAVEVAARVLAADPVVGTGTTALALLTLGSGLPIVALQSAARRVQSDIASLVVSDRIVWVDYYAPQDWMNFPDFDPVARLPLDLDGQVARNPLVRSAKFREIIDSETYIKVRWRPFRMHFQFLFANDRLGEYDFFAMALGPQRLRDRVTGPRVFAGADRTTRP
ncbi:alpha/beta hydrolase [Methylobacterium marchantiae]|uniref:Alpha/beta hydrolase n=1 Tax=Methylobacterium marchantiae TaxID=600331 RepID=A0ABW3WZ47_9HYPH